MNTTSDPIRPAELCRALLAALDTAESHGPVRHADRTANAFGSTIKRELLRRAVEEDPAADEFEGWLLRYAGHCGSPELAGPSLAVARAVCEEWRVAHARESPKEPSESAFSRQSR